MRALWLPLAIWSVPATALAHPLLSVDRLGDGTYSVECGPEQTMEPSCGDDDDCEGGAECREVLGLGRLCLSSSDVVCCFAGDDATSQCPAVEGYRVRCVEVSSTSEIVAGPGTAFCIYDPGDSDDCAVAASRDSNLALACHTTAAGGLDAPVAAEDGDCDRDGVPNVRDLAPCDRAIGAGGGARPDAQPDVEEWDYTGGGGCTCEVASSRLPTPSWLAIALVAIAPAWRRRRAASALSAAAGGRCGRRSTRRRTGRAWPRRDPS